jgi:hypothetical protein
MVETIMTPRGLMHKIVREVATERELSAEDVERGSSRRDDIRSARALVIGRLFERRLPVEQIARMMKLRRASVFDYLRSLQQQEANHGTRQDRAEGSAVASAAASGEKQRADRQDSSHQGEGQGRRKSSHG